MSVVLFDLDDFKRYNDTHGHNAGDAALREVARVAMTVVRRSDVVGRWGGDEFLLLLPSCEATAADRIARTLAAAVLTDDPQAAGMPAGISISTGVAELRRTDRMADLVARADEDMYRRRRAARAASQRAGHAGPRQALSPGFVRPRSAGTRPWSSAAAWPRATPGPPRGAA